jgi:hypothetical protein
MANLEVLALDTATPQIRAPGAGDGYAVPRDMTFSPGTTLSVPNAQVTNVKANDGTAAITIADSTGNVGIGTASPSSILELSADQPTYTLTSTNPLSTAGGTEKIADIDFVGQNNNLYRTTARIRARQSGTWSTATANLAPTALEFYTQDSTTSDAMTSARMTIDPSGNVGIGGTASAFDKVTVTGTLPTNSGNSIVFAARGTTPAGSTADYVGFNNVFSTAAASFTMLRSSGFFASQGTLGAGSAVTSQFGFRADSSLTGAANNYGFYSNIASGTNRWNFYAAGTAANYFAGTVSIGTTSTSDAGVVITPSVTRDGAWDAKLALQSTASGDYPTLYFSGCNATDRYGAIVQTTSTSGNASFNITSSIEFLNSSATAGNIVFKTNNTVGTGAAVERLRLKSTGQVRFQPLAADPAGAEAGDVYYNSGTNKLKVYDGSTWVDLN